MTTKSGSGTPINGPPRPSSFPSATEKENDMTRETGMQSERRRNAAAFARRQEAAKSDPVAKAAALTEAERKRIGEGQTALEQKSAEVARIGFRMRDLERTAEANRLHEFMGSTGGLFGPKRTGNPGAVQAAEAEREELRPLLAVARDAEQAALRRMRHVERQVAAARRLRRQAAEQKANPAPPKPILRTDGWQDLDNRNYGGQS